MLRFRLPCSSLPGVCEAYLWCRGDLGAKWSVGREALCDGIYSCPNGDDEKACSISGFTCPTDCECNDLTMNCSSSNLSFIPKYLESLRWLDVSQNDLHHIGPIHYAPYLKFLNLSRNPLLSLNMLFMLRSLELLDASHLLVTHVGSDLAGLESLRVLYLIDNPLAALRDTSEVFPLPPYVDLHLGDNFTQCCMLQDLEPVTCPETMERYIADCDNGIKYTAVRYLSLAFGLLSIIGNLSVSFRAWQWRHDDIIRFLVNINSSVVGTLFGWYLLVLGVASHSQKIFQPEKQICIFLTCFLNFSLMSSFVAGIGLAVQNFIRPHLKFNLRQLKPRSLVLLVSCLMALFYGVPLATTTTLSGLIANKTVVLDKSCHPLSLVVHGSWNKAPGHESTSAGRLFVVAAYGGMGVASSVAVLGLLTAHIVASLWRDYQKSKAQETDGLSTPLYELTDGPDCSLSVTCQLLFDVTLWMTVAITCKSATLCSGSHRLKTRTFRLQFLLEKEFWREVRQNYWTEVQPCRRYPFSGFLM